MKWLSLAQRRYKLPLCMALLTSVLAAGCALPHKQPPAEAQAAPPPTSPGADAMYDLLVAEIAGQRGDYAVAFDHYLQAARSTRDRRAAERAMQIAVFMRDKEKALTAARLWVDIDPDSLDARQGLVVFLLRNGQSEEALPHLDTILAAVRAAPAPAPKPAPSANDLSLDLGASAQGFMQIAALLGAEQDKPSALRLMERFVARHESDAEAHFAYANLALSAGDLSAAQAATDAALQRKPDWPSALVLRARILQAQGNTSAAITALGAAVKQFPKDLPLRLAYARMLVDSNRIKESRAQFGVMAQQAKGNVEVLLALGLVSMQIKQQDDAERYLNQVLKLGKRGTEAHYYLGQIAETKKRPCAAIEHYQKVTEGDAWFDAQLRIARLTAKESGLAAGRAYLHAIPLQNPQQQVQLIMAEGDMLSEQKQYDETMDLYNSALTEQPNDSNLLYARAMLAEKMGRLDLLEQDLRAVIEREPENATALNALGYTLADRTARYQEALGYIERALQLRPQDPSVIDSMGWVFYRLGRHQEALRYLKTARDLADDPEIAAHLGEVMWVTGDQKGALKIWEQGLKVNSENEVLLNTMQRFSR
ncbi:MAG: tetratricopeptide repeat protein [Proteobacteria bacterium]|nr:tetratricopeptide repeat protein [Pseudomonadota bacterium]